MLKRCVIWTAACALLALVGSLAGCASRNYKDPVPDQPNLPLTASWSGADASTTP